MSSPLTSTRRHHESDFAPALAVEGGGGGLANKLVRLLDRLRGKHVVILGDVMLDSYQHGEHQRLGPASEQPIYRVTRRTWSAGGAAHCAATIASLGGRVTLFGVVGSDPAGSRLQDLLARRGVDARLLVDEARPTTTKTRLMAGRRFLARIDEESCQELSGDQQACLREQLDALVERADALLVSDYRKGVVADELCARTIARARRQGKPIVVDPKGQSYERYRGATVVTPNLDELALASGTACDDEQVIVRSARALGSRLGDTAVLVTRAQDGLSLVQRDGTIEHWASAARTVRDPTGAGDAVAATLALSLGAGCALEDGIQLARHAAGLVVGRLGTDPIRPEELVHALKSHRRW